MFNLTVRLVAQNLDQLPILEAKELLRQEAVDVIRGGDIEELQEIHDLYREVAILKKLLMEIEAVYEMPVSDSYLKETGMIRNWCSDQLFLLRRHWGFATKGLGINDQYLTRYEGMLYSMM